MKRQEMIKALEKIKEAIANDEAKQLTDNARWNAYISVEDAIKHIRENED